MSHASNTRNEDEISIMYDKWAEECLQEHDQSLHQKLRDEVKQYFCSLPTNESDESEKKAPTPSSLLALLLSRLGPVFSVSVTDSDHYYPPVAGLYALCGSIEGILLLGRPDKISDENEKSVDGLSPAIQELLGNFLLERCRKDSNIQEMQDIAILCLQALLKSPSHLSTTKDLDAVKNNLMWRLMLSRQAVMYATGVFPEDDDEEDQENFNVVGDISEFPRLKRTACFNILWSALQGFQSHSSELTSIDVTMLQEMSQFVSLCTQCLHGESDPRCLVLLLNILRACQEQLLPFFDKATTIEQQTQQPPYFPYMEIFDAVAPYYPIKFTPPPNVANAITREELQNSLMSVLICYSPTGKTAQQNSSKATNDENMIELTSRLFLERLSPNPEDDDFGMSPGSDEINTSVDKLEALDDLNHLLLSQPCYTINEVPQNFTKMIPLKMIDDVTLADFSEALIKTHSEAAKADTDPNSSVQSNEKLLASRCRDLAVYVASVLEEIQYKQVKSSKWNVFVSSILKSLCSHLSSAPESMRGRTAAAFLSSVAFSGPETLRLCLRSCLPPLFGIFDATLENNDDERLTSICYSLAGFFGAVTKMEMRRIERNGGKAVILHPHPLASYGVQAFDVLYGLIIQDDDHGEEDSDEKAITIERYNTSAAAVFAMEALLLASPFYILSNDDVAREDKIKTLLSYLAHNICQKEPNGAVLSSKSWNKFNEMCAHAIGSMIGKSNTVNRDSMTSDKECVIYLSKWVHSEILPKLMESATESSENMSLNTKRRFDLMALARGCALSKDLADTLVVSIATALVEALNICNKNSDTSSTSDKGLDLEHITPINISMSLSYLMKNGGSHIKLAWTNTLIESSSIEGTPQKQEHVGFHIVRAMCGCMDGSEENITQSDLDDVVMDKLLLPGTQKTAENDANRLIKVASRILPYLLPCYKNSTPRFMNSIVQFVSPILPPLSQLDNVKVTITLPILSTALQSIGDFMSQPTYRNESDETVETICDELKDMTRALCDFTLSRENDSLIRSAAATIIYFTVHRSQEGASLASQVLESSIAPTLINIVKNLGERRSHKDASYDIACFEDVLNLTSLVGAATACRGEFAASQTANMIVGFFVSWTCSGKSKIPSTSIEVTIPSQFRKEISVLAAQAFGYMISIESGSPFWKQRSCFIAMTDLLKTCEKNHTDVDNFSLGAHIAVTHMICCVPLKAIGEENVKKVTQFIIGKLASSINCIEGNKKNPEDAFVTIGLGAIMKLLSFVPDEVTSHALTLIPLFLDICCNHQANTQMISISLQCITNIVSFAYVKKMINQDMKRNVLEKLSLILDHRSRVVRQSAVIVRNEWFLL